MSLMTHCICIPGLGDGWAPAILNSEEELAFIRRTEDRTIVIQSYYIGGSTDVEEIGRTIEYSDYIPSSSGNNVLCQSDYMIK